MKPWLRIVGFLALAAVAQSAVVPAVAEPASADICTSWSVIASAVVNLRNAGNTLEQTQQLILAQGLDPALSIKAQMVAITIYALNWRNADEARAAVWLACRAKGGKL